MEIKYRLTSEECEPLVGNGDWIDLRSAEDVVIEAPKFNIHTNEMEFHTGIISLGIAMELPDGYEAIMASRSSTFKNFGIIQANSIGVIDNTYKGNDDIWRFPFIAIKSGVIKKGDRICQFRVIKSQFSETDGDNLKLTKVDVLNNLNRGGIGSTGIK